MNEEKLIARDRMRYTKNSLSSTLAYLAIVFDVLYFISIYKSDVGSYYYNILIGASILYNLVFLLAAFLASEGVKNYSKGLSWLMCGLGAGQIVRIFIIPVKAHAATVALNGQDVVVMENGQFARVVVYLVLSAACCIASGAVGLYKSKELSEHLSSLTAEG